MKKTVNVNIGGFIFHLDEDAYEKTMQYLQALGQAFRTSDGGEEIMQDIETRISEIFRERTGTSREVITSTDVDYMIGIMGQPEAYMETGSAEPETKTTFEEKAPKRLFRDPDQKVFGGVCSGLAAYLGIDPVIIRVIFAIALLLWGTSLLIYIILWIAMPKAITTSEKLQMKGKKINISNIEKSVRTELGDIGKNRSKFSKAFHEMMDNIAGALHEIFRYTGKVIGLIFIVIALIILICFIRGMFFNAPVHFHSSGLDRTVSIPAWDAMTMLFNNNTDVILSLLAVSLLILIPLTGLLIAGIKLVFGIKQRIYWLRVTGGALWGLALVLGIYQGIRLAENFRHRQSEINSQEIPVMSNQTIYLKSSSEHDKIILNSYKRDELNKLVPIEHVSFDIERNEDDSLVRLEVIRIARGRSLDEAASSAQKIRYEVYQTDSTLIFTPAIMLSFDEKFRGQQVKLTLQLPDEQKVYLHKSMREIIDDIDNIHHMWDRHMLGKTWIMKKEGLTCITCTKEDLEHANRKYLKRLEEEHNHD